MEALPGMHAQTYIGALTHLEFPSHTTHKVAQLVCISSSNDIIRAVLSFTAWVGQRKHPAAVFSYTARDMFGSCQSWLPIHHRVHKHIFLIHFLQPSTVCDSVISLSVHAPSFITRSSLIWVPSLPPSPSTPNKENISSRPFSCAVTAHDMPELWGQHNKHDDINTSGWMCTSTLRWIECCTLQI